MKPLFELQGAGAAGPLGPVFQGLDWQVRKGVVTAILGPAGCGKSTLLRGLSGRALAAGWVLTGTWLHCGEDLLLPGAVAPSAIAWMPQFRPVAHRPVPLQQRRWRELLESEADTVLLDEPTRGGPSDESAELAQRLRALTPRRSALVVTHNLAFARAVADDICLICAGRIEARGEARAFFESPPNELSERFVRQGNCWPSPSPEPALPSHFRWLLPGKLAGMAQPGLLGDIETDLQAVAAAGATLLVSLTEEAVPPDRLQPLGMLGRHFPIPDMGVPGLGPTANLCRDIEQTIDRGGCVVLHCRGGMGRTGTIAAAALVWMGWNPDDAIAHVRSVARGYIQNRTQADFVARFAAAVGKTSGLKGGSS